MVFILRCVGIKNQRHSFIQSLGDKKLWVKTWNYQTEINFKIWCRFVPAPSLPQLLILQLSTDIYWLMSFVHLFASPVETSDVKCCDYCHWQMHNNLLHVRRPQQKPCSYANTSRYLPDLWPMQRDRWRYLQNSKNLASYPQ